MRRRRSTLARDLVAVAAARWCQCISSICYAAEEGMSWRRMTRRRKSSTVFTTVLRHAVYMC